jgi:hypothetical protein
MAANPSPEPVAAEAKIDETPIRYLSPGHGRTKLGYLWACNQPQGDMVFHWATTRAASCLEKIVPGNFTGKIQSRENGV